MLSIRTSALTLSVSSIWLRLMKPLSVILTFSRPWPPRGQNKSLVAWGLSDQNDFKIVSSGRKRVQYKSMIHNNLRRFCKRESLKDAGNRSLYFVILIPESSQSKTALQSKQYPESTGRIIIQLFVLDTIF